MSDTGRSQPEAGAAPRGAGRAVAGITAAIAWASCAGVAVLLLAAVARPIATDDAWWHLALGAAFAREGPWLAGDPLLFTATGPASHASWLADVLLAQALAVGGFPGLRVAHVAAVAAVLALAAWLLRREAASGRFAALATAAFATLAAYRLFQLRPELATVLATLLLYAFVLRPRMGPGAGRIAACTVAMAVWANLHAGFALGPILVAVALAGSAGGALLAGATPADRLRMRRLLLAGVLGALATLANPGGLAAHLAYLRSGADTPLLTFLGDEWRPLAPFAPPATSGPPSLAAWLLVWGLVAGTLAATWWAVAGWRWRARSASAARADPTAIDPALVALAWAALAAMVVAVRFLWLGILPLLLLAQASSALRSRLRRRPAITALPALIGPALLAAFVWIGPWPRISDVLHALPVTQPYAGEKYFVDPIWLIRDAGLEGHLFTDYELGGFAGFWLAPRVRTFVNGSLNVAPGVVDAYFAVRRRSGLAAGESFPDLLDRLDLDLFLGTGTPDARPGSARSTTAHLERTPGWIPVFRNLTSALYLRVRPRNAANLDRIAEFYRRAGVPFDRDLGFEPGRVIREQPGWAAWQRLIPEDFPALEREAAGAADPQVRRSALTRIASVLAMLGDYEAALARLAEIRRLDPHAVDPIRRTLGCLLRAGRLEEAHALAAGLDVRAGDALLRTTARLARSLPSLPGAEVQARIRRLPLLTPAESAEVTRRLRAPALREP